MAPITGGGCWEPLGPQSCLSGVGPGVEIADPSSPAGGSNGGLLGAFGGFLLTSSSSPPGSLCPHSSTVPSPFPAPRLSVFGGDYAVLTLEYELGSDSSQILELGKAGARAGIREQLEHLCLDGSRCLTLPPTEKRSVSEPQTSFATAKVWSSSGQLGVPQTLASSAFSVPRPRSRQMLLL